MIDYDKINEYVATMLSNSVGCCRLTKSSLDGILGMRNLSIREKDLHEGFEYAIARNKREVEEAPYATEEQKESEKNRREYILRTLEECIKSYLKSQHRLL